MRTTWDGHIETAQPNEPNLEQAAREAVGESLVGVVLRQLRAEFLVSIRRVFFRRNDNFAAVRAYCAMSVPEFEGINARQRWANWRTIPRSLLGRLPAGPCRALDLCSGVGHSTQVIAYCLPRGSEVLGLEFNPTFVAAASRRDYRDASGHRVKTTFRAQSVLESFRDVRGHALPDGGLDVVNSCGALGIHFTAEQIDRLAGEIARVLKPGGIAAVDAGKAGVGREQMVGIFERRGFVLLDAAKSCFLDRFTHLSFRKS